MKVLITGAYGFIGFYLAKRLFNDGHEVFLIDDCSKRQHAESLKLFIDFIQKNDLFCSYTDLTNCNYLRNESFLGDIQFDIVYHLAAINGTSNFYERPSHVIRNNFMSTMNILNNINTKKFVFTSSCETYSCSIRSDYSNVPTDENISLSIDDVFNPRWSYGGSKILEELYVTNYCKEKNIDSFILRYHNIYGVRDSLTHVIPALINRIMFEEGDTITIYGNDTRSFLYIDDCIEYTVRLADNCMNGIYNVGVEKETFIIDVAKKIMALSNIEKKIIVKNSPKGSVGRRCPDMTKTIRATCYTPDYDLHKGLKVMISNYKRLGFVI